MGSFTIMSITNKQSQLVSFFRANPKRLEISAGKYLRGERGNKELFEGVTEEDIYLAKKIARSPENITINSRETDKGDTKELETNSLVKIETKEQLIAHCNIDVNEWEITKWVQNYWGNVERPYWQVKLWLSAVKDKDKFESSFLKTLEGFKFDYKPYEEGELIVNSSFDNPSSLLISMADFHLDKRTLDNKSMDDKIKIYWDVLKRIVYKAYRSHNIEEIVFVTSNDFMHVDTYQETTTRGTQQQALVPWYDSYEVGFRLQVEVIQFLRKHCQVLKVVHVPSNHCHSSDTECLTEKGWKSYQDLDIQTDRVATYDIKNNKLVYQNIKDIHVYDYCGKMHNWKGKTQDLLVTPNHRILYKGVDERYSKIKYETSSELKSRLKSQIKFICSGSEKKEEYPIDDDWLRLFAWINSDGSVRAGGKKHLNKEKNIYVISQSKEKNVRELKRIFSNLNIGYREYLRKGQENIEICNKRLKQKSKDNFLFEINSKNTKVEILDFLRSNLVNKYEIPEILKKCSERQIDIYLKSYVEGDGTIKKGYHFDNGHGATIYGLKGMLDDLQKLAATNGYKTTLINYRDNDWRLYIKKQMYSNIDVRNIESIQYQGKVWCLTVENDNFMVRRNGKVSFQGNSRTKEFYMVHALSVMFRNDENILFDRSAEPTKCHTYGVNFIGFHHGDVKSYSELPNYFASKYRKEWGMAKFSEIALADKHHRKEWKHGLTMNEVQGTRMFICPSLSGADLWHKDNLYDLAIKASIGRVYDKEKGYTTEFEERI